MHPPADPAPPDAAGRLRDAVGRAAHLLPAQGPITVFIHHNTLHAYEGRAFPDAVRAAAGVFGCEPYLAEERYRFELARGRVRGADLRAVLADDLGEGGDDVVAGLLPRHDLRLAMLEHPTGAGPAAELAWVMAETDATRRPRPDVSAATRARLAAETRRWVMRDARPNAGLDPAAVEAWGEPEWEAFTWEALWAACLAGVGQVAAVTPQVAPLIRHRDLLKQVTGQDADLAVHEPLVRFCAGFLDQGVSHWPLPGRELGFYRAFLELAAEAATEPAALRGLPGEAARLLAGGGDALAGLAESLSLLGVAEAEWADYLGAAALVLRGWGGMVAHLEERGDRVAQPAPAGSLAEFFAVRLLLDRLAAAQLAHAELGYAGPLAGLRAELTRRLPPPEPLTVEQRAFPLFQLAQLLGWSPERLSSLDAAAWAELEAEVAAFPDPERRRVFHLAYERRFRVQSLDALALHPRRPVPAGVRPRFQAITCIDEREESFRRHIEEAAPDAETFGAAGFFGVAMYYKGAADAHFVPLCPIVLTPKHWVEERVGRGHELAGRRRSKARRAFGAASRGFQVGTRSAAAGALLTGGVGVLASLPLVARVLFPRLAARLSRALGRAVRPPEATELDLEQSPERPAPQPGYTAAEMAGVAERLLRDIGLLGNFARLVAVVGHGSHSQNNPHESAHDCGACGGSPGAANGRALARMLNDPRVRAALAANGIEVPADTWFVGGLHDTCDDSVELADADLAPATHAADLARLAADLSEAGDRNAHERCRRFASAPLSLSVPEARRHVEGRSEDLAQTRPEWGHATNALCVVGRRERTRGLYLDRRAFLVSYDPAADDAAGAILARILAAAGPVCAGINLEYYFSRVDQRGYGAGTKLPHNVTGLVGVMDGAQSDLRTGLPWELVEIHEPVRLLFIIETTPEIMAGIIARNPALSNLFNNGWVQLAVLDPGGAGVRHYRGGRFEPHAPEAAGLPAAATSADWYRGWRDHLDFAEVGAHA